MIKTKYILRRSKNGRKRTKHVAAAVYISDKEKLQATANAFAQKNLGHQKMSISAYINIKLLLP